MSKTVYEIIESFVPFEKLKKCQSLVHLKPSRSKKVFFLSKSSIDLNSNPLASERNNEQEKDLTNLKENKKRLLGEIAKLQFKSIELKEKEKERMRKLRNFKKEEEKLRKEEKNLTDDKRKRIAELKSLELSFTVKNPDFFMKKTQMEEIKRQLAEVSENFIKNSDEINEKTDDLKRKLLGIKTSNSEIIDKLKEDLQEQETFKKHHNIYEIKGKITKGEYELQALKKQIQDLETIKEIEEKQRKETQDKLMNEISNKNKAIEQAKTSKLMKEEEFTREILMLTENFNEKMVYLENFKEIVRKQKNGFLKSFKESDEEKLQLFKESASKKESYDNKYKKFIEFAKQKSYQIDFKRLSSVDIEVEEMRESKRLLKSTFESQMKEVLLIRDSLRIENNSLNEKYQAEMLKKTSWNMKLNRNNEEKKTKADNYEEDIKKLEKLSALKEKLVNIVSNYEANKEKINDEFNKIKKNNDELRKYWDSISDLRVEIDEKKREKQWFSDIKKEISSQKEATLKKIKEMKKLRDKTQKELNSQKEALTKFKEKIDKLEKLFEDLERKNQEFS